MEYKVGFAEITKRVRSAAGIMIMMSLLLHCIGTGPSNCAPFQSTGPLADIIKLEDRTASRTASHD